MIKEARRNAHYLGDYASLLTDFFVISYPEMITSLEDYNTVRMGVEYNIKTMIINRIDLFSVLRIFLLNEFSDNLYTMNIVHITIIKHKPNRKLAMIIW
jgi:hypothetical protein